MKDLAHSYSHYVTLHPPITSKALLKNNGRLGLHNDVLNIKAGRDLELTYFINMQDLEVKEFPHFA